MTTPSPYKHIHPITSAWRILYPLLYLFLIVFIGGYAFMINDQGRDFFIGVIANDLSVAYLLNSSLSIIVWCLVLWYSGRILLQTREIEVPSIPFTIRLIKWLPRIIGILPLIVAIAALLTAQRFAQTENARTVWINIIILMLAAGLLLLFFSERSRIAHRMGIHFATDQDRFNPQKKSIRTLLQSAATRHAMLLIIAFALLMILPYFTPISWGYARLLQPATVVVTGLILITFLSSVTAIYVNPKKSPLILVVCGYVLLVSTCNNNNLIQPLPGNQNQRQALHDNIREWLQARESKDTGTVYPIYLIAAEGGGSRAAAWTALVLKKLEERRPGFMQHVYAISGVSGGGVGAAFFTAWWKDRITNRKLPEDGLYKTVTADFLSDVTSAFLFHDNLQRVIPIPIPSFSRNRKIEESWSHAYNHHLYSPTFREGFLHLWDDTLRYAVPNLFINGLLSETGQKAITTNLQLDIAAGSPFGDDIDIMAALQSDLSLATAASLGARFPIITSGALLQRTDGKKMGHILDGGYIENSGIETAWQIALTLSPVVAEMEIRTQKKYPIRILLIQNSNDGVNVDDEDYQPSRVMPDFTTILPGFLNAWQRRTTTYKNISQSLFGSATMKNRFAFFEIRLNNAEGTLPLGWYLSDAASQNIRQQANAIPADHPVLVW